jgi:hypothetical protein
MAAANGKDSSFSDQNIEFSEAKLTLESVAKENRELQAKLLIANEQVRSLSESLGIANSESEFFKRELTELRLRMEALGIDSSGSNKNKLEQRLLKAVNDLKVLQEEKDKISDHLVRLSEVILRFIKTADNSDPQARMEVEAEMRSANEAIGIAPPQAVEAQAVDPTLQEGLVIYYKQELGLVIANLGRQHGVKPGMPFEVWRGGRKIALVKVVDIREKISGSIIQEMDQKKDQIKVGDTLRVAAAQ